MPLKDVQRLAAAKVRKTAGSVVAVSPLTSSSSSRSGRGARGDQLAYSQIMAKMLDEEGRRTKARKIISIIEHALGRPDLSGLRALDVGCSAGFIADELAVAGAQTIAIDIDEQAVSSAKERFGARVDFRLSRGEEIPLPDASVDVVVFNHIYEHVVDPVPVVAEIHRVLSPSGVAYLGLGHKWQIIEPHHRLPFLSWLPPSAADSYMRATGRGDHYYERFRTPKGLRRLFQDFDVWDYTLAVLAEPERFHGDDIVPEWVRRIPQSSLKALLPLVPTYLWVAFKRPRELAGQPLLVPPTRVG